MHTSAKIFVIGLDHTGLDQEKSRVMAKCHSVFTTARFNHLLNAYKGIIHPITPLKKSMALMTQELRHGNLAVLASGDPLFFGIGRSLLQAFDRQQIIFYPAISSMQLAFCRFKEPWDNACCFSLHGRSDENVFNQIIGRNKIFFLTDHHNSPDRIARLLLENNQHSSLFSAANCTVFVAENLGLADEKITIAPLAEISNTIFSDLNVMLIKIREPIRHSHQPFGLTEKEINHSRGLITKDEVRAVVLHKLRLPTHGIFWDIGAGSGSVSIEACRLFPNLKTYAIEKQPPELANIKKNSNAFELANLSLIEGEAPHALSPLPPPDRVFIGGSGGNLASILKHSAQVLSSEGTIIVNAVTSKTGEQAPALLYELGFLVEISEIRVTRSVYPSSPTKNRNLNPILIITGTRSYIRQERNN